MKKIFCAVLAVLFLMCPMASAHDAGTSPRCVNLSLACNPSTGYTWTATGENEAVATAEDLGVVTFEDDPWLVGSPAVHNFRITGISAGEAYFTFSYNRPWESTQPLYYFWVEVTVDEQLNVTMRAELVLPGNWEVEMDQAGVLNVDVSEPDEDGNQHFKLTAVQDGTVTLLLCNRAAGSAYEYQVLCADGSVSVYAISLRWEDGIPFAPEFLFDTTDLDGNPVTEQIFAGHSLTILNFWEPWCGPCVSELPALQKLSEEYADRGVQVIGVFSTPDCDEEIRTILERRGVTYPILRQCSGLDFLQTMYVPTSVVIGSSGNILKGSFAGALDYDGWVKLVESLL